MRQKKEKNTKGLVKTANNFLSEDGRGVSDVANQSRNYHLPTHHSFVSHLTLPSHSCTNGSIEETLVMNTNQSFFLY